MLKIYTAQYRYSGKDRVDITASGKTAFGRFFMPGWSMVKGLKNGTITEEQYERDYRTMMIDSWREHKHVWHKLMEMEQVTLVCFCPPGHFCHRLLLAGYLERLGAVHMGERNLRGGKPQHDTRMNILDAKQGILCQQVNCRGVMGAGLAKQFRSKWQQVYDVYRKLFEEGKLRVGKMHIVPVEKNIIVANLCGQDRYGRDKRYTDYIGLRKAMLKLAEWRQAHCELTGNTLPVYFPHGMGCTLAGGDWYLVHCMIKNIFPDAVIVRYR